jgi:hypothetical protein
MRGIWLLVIGLVGCAGPQTEVPEALRLPTDEVAVLRLRGAGAQVYECKANTQDPAKHAWILKAPDAQLYDGAGMVVGKHYAGPTWESLDGSRIVGEVRARADAPDPNAIPWLLLATRSTGGAGVLSRVKSVQRLDTVGGKAPASCDAAQAGQTLRVSYSAAYVFAVNR